MYCLLALFALALASCSQQKFREVIELDPTNEKHAQYHRLIENQDVDGIPFPEGSQLIDLGNSKSRIVLPKGYHYIGFSQERSRTFLFDDGEITCECNKGTGCGPVKSGDKLFCGMADACSVCSKTVSRASTNEILDIIGIYKDGEPTIRFAVTQLKGDEFMQRLQTNKKAYFPSLNPAIFNLEDVKNDVMGLYNMIYNNNIPSFILNNEKMPKGYKYAQVEIYGNSALIPVPENSIMEFGISYFEDEADGTACKCKAGKGCILKGYKWLGIEYCDATGCSKCSMSF